MQCLDQYGSTVRLNADGSYSYTMNNLNADIQTLHKGESLTPNFIVVAQDKYGATDSTTVTVHIAGTDDAPIFEAVTSDISSFVVQEAGDKLIGGVVTAVEGKPSITGSFIAADRDSGDTDSLTFTLNDAGGHALGTLTAAEGWSGSFATSYGTLLLSFSGGKFTYTYALNNNGPANNLPQGATANDSFSVVTTDTTSGLTASKPISITVQGTNDRPVILGNALAGSGLLILWATVFGTPLGIMAGIYLAEYGRKSVLAEIIRFINDILLSAPSIVVGLFVYTIVVAQMQHFSGWAGVIALALLQVPIVIRTTENMLKLVPDSLREAAYALGTPKWKMISAITLKASVSGIMTGILLAIARIAGETAPLLFTALSNQFWSTDMMQPIANLPVTIFKFAMSPFAEWQQLAWAGVLIITLCVLLLNILARVIFAKKKHG